VRLGFVAPRDVQIHREEVLTRAPRPGVLAASPLPQPDAVVSPNPEPGSL
jgi:hypothetical protein